MIILASINNKAVHRGVVYCTTIRPMGALPLLDFLRPTKEMVYGIKYRGWSDDQYDDAYRALLRSRWAKVKPWLDGLTPETDMTLTCYCRTGARCHRAQIQKMLLKWRPDIETLLV